MHIKWWVYRTSRENHLTPLCQLPIIRESVFLFLNNISKHKKIFILILRIKYALRYRYTRLRVIRRYYWCHYWVWVRLMSITVFSFLKQFQTKIYE